MLLMFLQKRICFSCAGIAVMMDEIICFVIFFQRLVFLYNERNGYVYSLNRAEFNFFKHDDYSFTVGNLKGFTINSCLVQDHSCRHSLI